MRLFNPITIDGDSPEGASSYLLYLFAALVFMLLVVPLAESEAGGWLMNLGLTAVLISAAVATRRRRGLLIVGLMIVAVAVSSTWASMLIQVKWLFVVSCLIESAFFVSMAIVILIGVIKRHLASFHAIFGVICSYLLLGLAFAMLYLALARVAPKSFEPSFAKDTATESEKKSGKDSNEVSMSKVIYFSFVTMSTLGYGDVLPTQPTSRTLAWMQSVTGQFYLAVMVAWIVAEIPRHRRHGLDEETGLLP